MTRPKKPGDFIEADADGNVIAVYEVTTKPFGGQRVAESRDTLMRYADLSGTVVRDVQVLCRECDIHPDAVDKGISHFCLGRVEHSGVSYYFINVYEWIRGILMRIPALGRKNFFVALSDYISHPNTATDVKRVWRELNKPD